MSSVKNRDVLATAGIWMAAVLVAYITFNAVRASINPAGFAADFGVSLGDSGNTAFVYVYAIRALFLGMFGLVLLLNKSYQALAWFTLVGVVMPIGDALLVVLQGGGGAALVSHAIAAVFLLLTGTFLLRVGR